MSGGLAPSKSTVYVANIPFSLTNNDLHKLFEKYGKIVKVTIVKDKRTRKSRGVAFVLYLEREAAHEAVKALNMKTLLGRTLKCSIAVDNGRASEFIRRKVYVDKSRCFECGEEGHLSYRCPKNSLGDREPPKKKEKKKRRQKRENEEAAMKEDSEEEEEEEAGEEDESEDPSLESLGAAIRYQQEQMEEEEYRYRVATGEYGGESSQTSKRKKFKTNSYFSDEEEISD